VYNTYDTHYTDRRMQVILHIVLAIGLMVMSVILLSDLDQHSNLRIFRSLFKRWINTVRLPRKIYGKYARWSRSAKHNDKNLLSIGMNCTMIIVHRQQYALFPIPQSLPFPLLPASPRSDIEEPGIPGRRPSPR